MKYGGGFYILRIMLLCPPPVKIYSLAYWSARKPIFTHMKESSQYYFLGCQFTLRGRLSAGQISFFLLLLRPFHAAATMLSTIAGSL